MPHNSLSALMMALCWSLLACNTKATVDDLSDGATQDATPGVVDAAPSACAIEEAETYFADEDGDGYGSPLLTAVDCTVPAGFVVNDQDCDDSDSRTNPSASERCDGIDNDCNADTAEVCPAGCSVRIRALTSYLFCNLDWQYEPSATLCQGEDMQLIRIDNEEEHTWVSNERVATLGSRRNLWIGANDLETADSWVWPDGQVFWLGRANGTAVDELYTFWRDEQPDNGGGAACGMMLEDSPGVWVDRPCDQTHRFACERSVEIH